jgi:hypothetical protein
LFIAKATIQQHCRQGIRVGLPKQQLLRSRLANPTFLLNISLRETPTTTKGSGIGRYQLVMKFLPSPFMDTPLAYGLAGQ